MKRQGFSLLELMTTMVILAVVFVAASTLARDLSANHRRRVADTRQAVAAREALEFICRQARSAVAVSSGPSLLTLELLDPGAVRYTNPVPATLPTGWQPDQPRVTVVYQLSSGSLTQTSAGYTSPLINGLSGLTVTQSGPTLEMILSWSQDGRIRRLARSTYLPVVSDP
ncbi:MAG: type II secretion system protein [Vulcanimicrobiota bacterium]